MKTLTEAPVMEAMNPSVRNYLLSWRKATCAIALTCIAMMWVSVHIYAVYFLPGRNDALFADVAIGLMYLAAMASQTVFVLLAKKITRRFSSLCLSLLCVACALGVFVKVQSSLFCWLSALGFVCGSSVAFLLQDYMTICSLRTEKKGTIFPLTPCIGIALFTAGTITPWLQKNAGSSVITVCFSTFCAVFATGIHLKASGEIPLPTVETESDLYTPLKQRDQSERLEAGFLFLSLAISGAALTYLLPCCLENKIIHLFPVLTLLFGVIPLKFIERRMLLLLISGALLTVCCGTLSLWNPTLSVEPWGLCFGIFLALRFAEEKILPKKRPAQAGILLLEMSAAMLAGTVIAGVSLSLC